MNNSTNITLNDRFSILASVKPSTASGGPRRARSRSRSRSRPRGPGGSQKVQQGSAKNRNFIEKLEQKHQLLLAKKIKNVSSFLCLDFGKSVVF